MAFTDEQRANAQVIYNVGKSLGATDRDILVALSAALVESGLRNLNYGDRDSIGMFQQRDAWGSHADRLDPYKSSRMFFLGGAAGQEGLLDIGNRDSRGIGSLAQDVQVSAYPDRYEQRVGEARALLGGIDPSAEVPVVGTLGVVPGLEPTTPAGGSGQDAMVEAPSTVEVNGVGEVTADETGLGTLTFGPDGQPMTEQGPLDALTFGMAPSQTGMQMGQSAPPAGGGSSNGGGGGGGYDPMGSSYMPTLADYGIDTSGGAAGAGETYGPGTDFRGADPYGLTTRDGETLDNMTAAALQAAEREAGTSVNIMQGGHSSYAASGGTHEGLGVVDINVPNGDWVGVMTAMRKVGFAAWVRNVPGFGYAGSGAHIHAVLIGNEKLSPQAAVQVQSYLNNDDGLAGSRADDGPRDFVNNRFDWADVQRAAKPSRSGNRQVVDRAQGLLGIPFKWGGEDYDGLDSTGLVRKAYSAAGLEMPKYDLVNLATPIPIEDLMPGDVVSWDKNPDTGAPSLGIYVGFGQYISADRPGSVVQTNTFNPTGATAYTAPGSGHTMTHPNPSTGTYIPNQHKDVAPSGPPPPAPKTTPPKKHPTNPDYIPNSHHDY